MRGGSGRVKCPAVADDGAKSSFLRLVEQLSAISASIVTERCHKIMCPFIPRYDFLLGLLFQLSIQQHIPIKIMAPVADLSKVLDLSILRDKSVIVTGGASGLGALIATSFAENG